MVSHVREGRGRRGEAMAKSRQEEMQEWVEERGGGERAWRSGASAAERDTGRRGRIGREGADGVRMCEWGSW